VSVKQLGIPASFAINATSMAIVVALRGVKSPQTAPFCVIVTTV
jgi:hypothetical protein